MAPLNWEEVEEDMPDPDYHDFFVQVASIDPGTAGANIHPYFYAGDDDDCIMVGHTCNCPRCQAVEDLSSPAKKPEKQQVATAIAVENSPTVPAHVHPQPLVASTVEGSRSQRAFTEPGSPGRQPKGLVISENLRSAIEDMANEAPIAFTAGKEKAASKSEKPGKTKRKAKEKAKAAARLKTGGSWWQFRRWRGT